MAPIGLSWLLILVLGGGSVLPLAGIPPRAEDPALLAAVPAECVLYVGWNGTAPADPGSENRAEALVGEPAVRRLAVALETELLTALRREAAGDRGKAVLLRAMPDLLRTAVRSPGFFCVQTVAFGPEGPQVDAALVVRPDDPDAFRGLLGRVHGALARGEDVGSPADPTAIRSLPGAPLPVAWAVRDGFAVIGIGDGVADRTLAGLTSTAAGGAPPAWLETIRTELAVDRPVSSMYLDLDRLRSAIAEAGAAGSVRAIIRVSGLEDIRSLAQVSGLDGEGFAVRTLARTDGEPTGLFRLAAGEPLPAGTADRIPGDATFAAAGALRFSEIGAIARDALAAAGAPANDNPLDELDRDFMRELGFSPETDLLPMLGDYWYAYSAPSHGGLLFSGATLVVDVADPAGLETALDRIAGRIQLSSSGGRRRMAIGEMTAGNRRVRFLNGIGIESPVAVAWTLAGDELVIAAYPQMVVAHLDRAPDAPSLADQAAFAETVGGVVGDPVAFAYADVPTVFRTVYPVLHPLAALVCGEIQREGIALDMSLLPPASAIQPHLTPLVRTVTRTEAGFLAETRGSLPIGAGGIGAAIPMFIGFRVPMAARSMGHVERIESSTPQQMVLLGQALQMFEIDHGRCPASLDELTLMEVPYITTLPPVVYEDPGDLGDRDRSTVPVAVWTGPGGHPANPWVLYADGHIDQVDRGALSRFFEFAPQQKAVPTPVN